VSAPIPIYLAVEDELSEWVVRRILASRPATCYIGAVYGKRGFGYLKKQSRAFNNAAKSCPFLLLTDLDRLSCAPLLIDDWLNVRKHPKFLLRVAVREIESWLLGDDVGFGSFLALRSTVEFSQPETLKDAKQELLRLSFNSPKRALRESLVCREESSGMLFQGPDYNGVLSKFVNNKWGIGLARKRCPSLEKFVAALERLEKG
jgi:hypothetical protein